MSDADEYYLGAAKTKCNADHLFFTRYFFKQRQGAKFLINWHHHYIADEIDKVFDGETKNLIINVPPGSSKTEMAVINAMARGIAKNPRARFLHLSGSDELAKLNSQTSRDIVSSDEFQSMWPRAIATDSKSKKRWNVKIDGKSLGGVYATSISGQVTGFRAGHMTEEFSGALIIDDPVKPEDAYSKLALEKGNRKLQTTVKSRRATPKTPIILIMQRIAENDATGFILNGGLQGEWKHISIPALIDDDYVASLPEKYWELVDSSVRDENGRYSYWEYKEPLADLLQMETGMSKDKEGNQISRQVFSSQYQQAPTALGGNIFKGKDFVKYTVLPKIRYRKIYADTAQKTAERNDFSVFECWGYGEDHRIYLLDMIRGKWQAPELKSRAIAFWAKNKEKQGVGMLRELLVEDKSSGTGLVQSIATDSKLHIPVKGIERNRDKYLRSQDGLPYIQAGLVCVPEDAPFTNDFIAEHEAFTADGTHAHDDQIDPCLDAIEDMLSSGIVKTWEKVAKSG